MSNFLQKEFYGNTFLEWLIALLIISASIVVGKFIYWFLGRFIKRLTHKTKTELDDIIIDMIEEPIIAMMVLFVFRYAFGRLTFSDEIVQGFGNVFTFASALIVAWLVLRFYEALHNRYLTKYVSKTETDLDDQLLPIIKSIVKFIVVALGIIVGLNNAGYDVGAILAGLGIGGLAFALAAQDTVSNIFGGITIFLQRPFSLGDRISVNGIEGYIRQIGLRSSRLQTPPGEWIMVPNKVFIESAVQNLDVGNFYFQKNTYHLHRGTSIEQIEALQNLLRQFGDEHEDILWALPSLEMVGEYFFEIAFLYGVKTWAPGQKYADHYHKNSVVKSEVNMGVLKILDEHQIKLALPMGVWVQADENDTSNLHSQ